MRSTVCIISPGNLASNPRVLKEAGPCMRLTSRIFTYLPAGVPAVMSDTPAQRALAADPGDAAVLVSLANPAAITAALDRLAGAPARFAEAKRTAWRLGRERCNWDIERNVPLMAVGRAFAAHGHDTGEAVR